MARTKKVTITLLESMKTHTDNVSGYLTELAERAERRRLLREELDRYQGEFGVFTDDEMAEARALLQEQAERDGTDLAMSAATIIEASHSGVDIARLSLLLSRIRVEAVTKESARRSAGLLPAPVAVLASDVDDMAKLCGHRVRTIGL